MPTVAPFLSQKFRFWSFLSMVLLVFVHGYNLHERYLQPWTAPSEAMTFTAFIQYFLANALLRFRIPMLFVISGYLFAWNDYQAYGQRMGKRVRTLLLPYLLWSAFGLLLTYALESLVWGRQVVQASGMMYYGEGTALLSQYPWYAVLVRWLLWPVPFQLWFVRVLLIYNLAYPAIRWCVQQPRGKYVFFSVLALAWIFTFGIGLVEGEGLLFFSLGIWLQKNAFDLSEPPRWLRPSLWLPVWVGGSLLKTLLAFKGVALLGDTAYHLLAMLHKVVVFAGLVGAWYGLDVLVRACMRREWFVWLTAFSFFIYGMHAPLVTYGIEGVYAFAAHLPYFRLLAFVFLPLSIIALSIGLGAIMRRLWPKGYGWMTGGRGL